MHYVCNYYIICNKSANYYLLAVKTMQIMSKKALKQKSENIFEKYTGNKLYHLTLKGGKKKCQIAPCTRILFSGSQQMVGHVAAAIYLNKPTSEITTVIQTCGIKNCVDPSHLLVDGVLISEPEMESKTSGEEQEIDTPDENGFFYGYPPDTWNKLTPAGKELARKGKYNPSIHGWSETYTIKT